MELRLLGAVEAHHDGARVDFGHSRQRAVVALLAVNPNTPVTTERLIDGLWGEAAPQRARRTLHTYLSRVRKLLSVADDVDIEHRHGGYLLRVPSEHVDLHRFRRLVAAAATVEQWDEALSLWRGEAFDGLDFPGLVTLRGGLEMERLNAQLDQGDLLLREAAHARLVPRATDLAARFPWDERVAAQLMLALYRGGRQAEALEHYERLRRELAEQLGSDPGPRLRELHRQILTAEAVVEPASAAPTAAAVPRQLPAAPRRFAGRSAEKDVLDTVGGDSGDPIAVVTGPGGVGKTWLVLRWAHDNLDRFPDGQLHLDLRGFDPHTSPLSTKAAILGLLEGLGVREDEVPSRLDAQVGLYRSLLADKRMLIVLDNARDSSQLTPLLPGGSTCITLVTSRQVLPALSASHDATRLRLDVMSRADAHAALVAHLGAARLAAEPEVAGELLDRCAGLPLALGIIAARAKAHPDFPLETVAADLREAATRLDTLDSGELTASLRAVFDTSRTALSPAAAAVFGHLGLMSVGRLRLEAVASAAGQPVERCRMLLRELEEAHLIEQFSPNRYRMHDLTHLYAIECAPAAGPKRSAAYARLVDHYIHSATLGVAQVLARAREELPGPESGTVVLSFADEREALNWFGEEHANMREAQRIAAGYGWAERVWRLPWTMRALHHLNFHAEEEIDMWQRAAEVIARDDDPRARAVVHCQLGKALVLHGDPAQAAAHIDIALSVPPEFASSAVLSGAGNVLSVIAQKLGDAETVLPKISEVVERLRSRDEPASLASALNAQAMAYTAVNDLNGAIVACEQALELVRDHDNVPLQAAILDTIGVAHRGAGNYPEALRYFRQSLELFASSPVNEGRNMPLENLLDTYLALDDLDNAHEVATELLAIYKQEGQDAAAERVRARLRVHPAA